MSAITVLKNGAKMPTVGLGTWKAEPGVVKAAVTEAIKRGYRHLDCACDYGNEAEVGAGIKDALDAKYCTRDELWVTSKLWNTYHAKEHVKPACQKTLTDLGLDYVDLYLIHFPISLKFVPFDKTYPPEWMHDPSTPELNRMITADVPYRETWTAMEQLVSDGLCKNIGVSNLTCQSLMEIKTYCKIPPAVNQVEIHPHLLQKQLIEYCAKEAITITGFSPLGAASYSWLDGETQQRVLDEPVIKDIAKAHGKMPGQICIRWQVQRGLTVVPKSCNPERQSANLDVFGFELTEAEMTAINGLNKAIRYNDPGDFAKGFGEEWAAIGYPIYG